jgi:hypothetical protein
VQAQGIELIERGMVEHGYFSSMIIIRAADVGMKDGGNFIFFDRPDASNGLAVKPVVEDGLDRAVALGADVEPALTGCLNPSCAERLG